MYYKRSLVFFSFFIVFKIKTILILLKKSIYCLTIQGPDHKNTYRVLSLSLSTASFKSLATVFPM